jgi:hypothetical protein
MGIFSLSCVATGEVVLIPQFEKLEGLVKKKRRFPYRKASCLRYLLYYFPASTVSQDVFHFFFL